MRKECVRNFHLRLNPSFFSNFNPDHNPVALDDMFLFTVTYSSEVVNNLKKIQSFIRHRIKLITILLTIPYSIIKMKDFFP